MINIRKDSNEVEYYIVPSKIIAKNMVGEKGKFPSIDLEQVKKYRNCWDIFGDSSA